ncbi:MAG: glycosyltransferase, partial [Myxococcota bacterium]
PSSTRPRIAHVITGLDPGGAQSSLCALLAAIDDCDHRVLSLTGREPFGSRIEALGIAVDHLELAQVEGRSHRMTRALGNLRRFRPDWIHCWLYHADLFGAGLGWLLGARVLWHLHVSDLDTTKLKTATRAVIRACTALSHVAPEHIVACSHASLRTHRRLGYRRGVMRVIENGVDTERFRPRVGSQLRARWDIPKDAFVVGITARDDPQKDIGTFVQAASLFGHQRTDVHFVLSGTGLESQNLRLRTDMKRLGLDGACTLLGFQSEVEALYPCFDIFSLSSVSEGLSMSLLEAMACGVIPVVTDVGDSSRVVEGIGWTCPARDPEALAERWMRVWTLSAEDRERRRQAARHRVEERYAIQSQADAFKCLYQRRERGKKSRPQP